MAGSGMPPETALPPGGARGLPARTITARGESRRGVLFAPAVPQIRDGRKGRESLLGYRKEPSITSAAFGFVLISLKSNQRSAARWVTL